MPDFTKGIYQLLLDGEQKEFSMPLSFDTGEEATDAFLLLNARFNYVHFSKFRLLVDDCIVHIRINGTQTMENDAKECIIQNGHILDVSDYVKKGKNLIQIRLYNYGGPAGFSMVPQPFDPLYITFILLFILIAVVFSARVLHVTGATKKWAWGVSFIIAIGICIRLIYLLGTPYHERAYDVEGHIEYVHHLLDRGRLPAHGEGWQWYQPPLYYVMLTPMVGALRLAGASKQVITVQMQWVSFGISILTFFLVGYITLLLFRSKFDLRERLLFFGIAATFPGVVYFAARINNDILQLLWSVIAFMCLLLWWQQNKSVYWYCAIVSLCLGLLTKSNTVLLLPVAYLLLLFQKDLSLRQKWNMAWKSGVVILLLTEWLFLLRLWGNGNGSMVGNAGNLNSGLAIQNTTPHLWVFNPMQVLEHPFPNPWQDATRRQFFWEYLYRSAFFGEFMPDDRLHSLGITMLLLHFATVPLLLWGIVKGLWVQWRHVFPVFLLFVFLAAGHWMFRYQYPYSSSQDFRYSAFLFLPFAYFTVLGLQLSNHRVRQIYTSILTMLIIACGLFSVLLVS